MERGAVFIVDDEPGDVARFSRAFDGWPIVVAGSLSQAAQFSEAIDDVWLALLDVGLPDTRNMQRSRDEGVFRLAGVLRERWPYAVVAVVTGSPDGRLANPAHEVGAEFFNKFECEAILRSIAARLECRELAETEDQGQVLADMRAAYRLTPSETQIVALAMNGLRHREIADALEIRRNTVKTHVRSILEKTGAEKLADVMHWVTGRRRAIVRPVPGHSRTRR